MARIQLATSIATICILILNLFPSQTYAVDKTINPILDMSLESAPTQLDRLALLPKDSEWLFDFNAQPGYTYTPGSVVNANAATFPASVGTGMTLAMLNLGPCAMLAPHFHPRATNIVVAIEGTTDTYMVQENGARMVKESLSPGQMTIFPAGSVHSMQNTGCTNATLVSALNSQDTGTSNLANILFQQFPAGIVAAAFGGSALLGNNANLSKGIPAVGTGSVMGDAACVRRCEDLGGGA